MAVLFPTTRPVPQDPTRHLSQACGNVAPVFNKQQSLCVKGPVRGGVKGLGILELGQHLQMNTHEKAPGATEELKENGRGSYIATRSKERSSPA